MSAYAGGLRCPVCDLDTGEEGWHGGCPRCSGEGRAVNLLPRYHPAPADAERDRLEKGIFKYRRLLPIDDDVDPVSLDEGGTPLLDMGRLGDTAGVGSLHIKDETRNPTWSYKDRLAAVAVTRARHRGVDTVVVATTGNHGAAAAAYAAAAGLRCVALTMASVPPTMKTLMQAYGALVVAVDDLAGRGELMRALIAQRGWEPVSGLVDPPVGSNPWGVDGYKTIAYEIVEQLGGPPDAVVVPTAYADGLAGIARGFADLDELGRIDSPPRMIAVDPLGAYAAALEVGKPVLMERRHSVAFSIATPIATYQGLQAILGTGGTAVAVADGDEILAAQLELAREGVYLEASAAIGLPALRSLVGDGRLGLHDTVVLIGTSSGLKDVAATTDAVGEVRVIEPTLDAFDAVLEAEG